MNFYETLGVSQQASFDEIRTAYKKLALQYHPDKANGDREKFERVKLAYTALKDPSTRKRIDCMLSNSHDNTDSSEDNSMDEIVNVFMDILYEQVRKTRKCMQGKHTDNDICLIVNVDVKDIYQGCIKKIVTKVKRKGEWTRQACILKLFDMRKHYVFEKQSDECQGDIIVTVNIECPRGYSVIGNDLHLTYHVDLYTYLYGGTVHINILDTETIDIDINPRQKTAQVDGYGFSYMENNEMKYGNLILIFETCIDDNILQKEDVRNFIRSHFKSNE